MSSFSGFEIPELIAHRGFGAYAPENTSPAFNIAGAMGAKMVEFDVQLSKDGKLVVIHDENIERTTLGWSDWDAEKSKLVKDLNWEELENLDAGLWFNKDFAGVRIPLLEQVIKLCLDNKLLINLEIKTANRHEESGLSLDPEQDEKITQSLINWLLEIKEKDLSLFKKIVSGLVISSFSPEALYLVRENFSEDEVKLAYLLDIKNWDLDWLRIKEKVKIDMSYLSCVSLNLNQEVFLLSDKENRLPEIKSIAGSAVFLAYTVNDLARVRELKEEFGVAGVFSDQFFQSF